MIRLHNLGYSYPNQRSATLVPIDCSSVALKNLTLEIPGQSLVALLGPNGSGKSTLLKILAGELKPTQGRWLMSPELKNGIGYLPQQPQFDLTIPVTVFEVAAMGLLNKKGPFSAITPAEQSTIFKTLKQVGLHSYVRTLIQELSGGQLQRLRFARLLLEDAKLMLLDEPFNAVDEKTQTDLMELLLAQHRLGCTIITALHNKMIAQQYFPSHLLLNNRVGTHMEFNSMDVNQNINPVQTVNPVLKPIAFAEVV